MLIWGKLSNVGSSYILFCLFFSFEWKLFCEACLEECLVHSGSQHMGPAFVVVFVIVAVIWGGESGWREEGGGRGTPKGFREPHSEPRLLPLSSFLCSFSYFSCCGHGEGLHWRARLELYPRTGKRGWPQGKKKKTYGSSIPSISKCDSWWQRSLFGYKSVKMPPESYSKLLFWHLHPNFIACYWCPSTITKCRTVVIPKESEVKTKYYEGKHLEGST